MPIDDSRLQALLERADPSMKLRRLKKELEGDGEDAPGLREELLVATHVYENQKRLLARRESQRDSIPELALEKFDQNLAEVEMYLVFYEGQVEELMTQIEERETAIETLEKVGTTSSNGNKGNGNRTQRRGARAR